MSPVSGAAFTAGVACVLACGAETPTHAWEGEVTDSAGITIVSNGGAGVWSGPEHWRVERAFELADTPGGEDDIGLVAGFGVDARGRLIVIDLQARHGVLFDSAGRYLGTVGRPGEGPGEFSRLPIRHRSWVRRPISDADRFALRERLRERFVLLGVEPAIVDNLELTWDETFPSITSVQAGPDGTIWVQRMGDIEAVDPMVLNTNDGSNGLGGPEWDVFDPDGRFPGTVVLLVRPAADP